MIRVDVSRREGWRKRKREWVWVIFLFF